MPLTNDRRARVIEQATSFSKYLATTGQWRQEYEDNYAAAAPDDHERALLKALPQPLEVLAIVEDGCLDVIANLPIVARLAADTGALRLHVAIRDDSVRDVADAYPLNGRSHIPTYIFTTPDGVERGVLIERTRQVQSRIEEMVAGFLEDHTDLSPPVIPAGLSPAQQEELMGRGLRLRRSLRDLERRSIVEAIHYFAVYAVRR